ncbi:MAG TPA: MFS transporter [Nitrososphaerales archaeon]|nr:MFS transporter [Nitrososphaerales archaeon]
MKLELGGNLWHHRDFTRFWFSDTVSQFGSQFSGFALPVLAVLSFNATPLDIGIITALAIAPYPILGLFVGVWADRFRKRRIMVVCNLGRMATLASVPVGYVLGTLSLAQLFAVSLVTGLFSVFFDISYQAYLPILVDRGDLVEGNQKLQLSASGAQVAGPGMAGFVYQAIGGAFTVAADSIGYLLSAIALLSVKKDEPAKQRDARDPVPNFFAEMKEGVSVVLGNRYLRMIAGATATSNLGSNMVQAVLTIFALRTLRFTTAELGLVGSVGAVGFLVGVLVVNRFTKSVGLGRALALSILAPAAFVFYPLALLGYPFLVLSAVAFLVGMSAPAYNVNQISLRQAITPDRLQGRMNATMRTIVWGTIPVGSILGGFLGNSLGVVDTIYVGGATAGLAVAWIALGPVMNLRKQPEPVHA